MKKAILLILISTFSLLVLFAAEVTYPPSIEREKEIAATEKAMISAEVAIGNLSVVQVGFSNIDAPEYGSSIDQATQYKLDSFDSVSGLMKGTADIYLFYKMLASPQAPVTITVSIDGAMFPLNTAVTDTLDWKVDFLLGGKKYVISNLDTPDNPISCQVYPLPSAKEEPVNLLSGSGLSSLEYHAGSIKLNISTDEPYWNNQSSAYSGSLRVSVVTGA